MINERISKIKKILTLPYNSCCIKDIKFACKLVEVLIYTVQKSTCWFGIVERPSL